MNARRPDVAAWAIAVAYLLAAAALAVIHRDRINPDGISYLAVADHILAHRWQAAINGYWGPLLSWVLVPPLAVGVPPLVAARLVDILAGLLALWGTWRLATVAGLQNPARSALLLAVLPLLALGATVSVTPDMLLLAIWLHYLALVHRAGFGARPRDAVTAGILGVLAYLTKPYGFYVFCLHFGLCGAYRIVTATGAARRRAATALVLGLVVFGAGAAMWIGALSTRYGGLNVSTSGPYNRALVGPSSKGQPLDHIGFVAPPGDDATSAWEDPTGLPLQTWSPLASARNLMFQARLVLTNLKRLGLAVVQANYLGLFALPLAAVLALLARRRGAWPPEAWLIASLAIYPVGYLLVNVQTRYVWPTVVLGVIVTLAVVERLSRRPGRVVRYALLAAAVVGCWIFPLRELRAGDAQTPVVMATVARLRGAMEPGARLAADSHWVESIAIAYHLDARFHGVRGDLSPDAAAAELASQQVDWYLDWSADGSGAPTEPCWKPLASAAGRGNPRIYHCVRGASGH